MEKTTNNVTSTNKVISLFKFLLFSGFGIFVFFIEIEINGVSKIMITHLKHLVDNLLGPSVVYYALIMVCLGGILPLINKTYKNSKQDLVFTILKLCGIPICFMAAFNVGPSALMTPGMIPFLFNTVVISIAVAIPVIGIGFVPLLNYGLVEFLSIFLQPIMRKIWKTPGESAIDAIVSFTSSYAPAVLVTNDFYKRGIYTARESVIIATGFSTVAISFLVVIASTLNLMDHWLLFFSGSFITTFAVTAITARIYPISKMPNVYCTQKKEDSINYNGSIFKRAFEAASESAQNAKPFHVLLKEFYLNGAMSMTASVTASILSVGLIGLILVEFTPVFDIIGYIFYPITYLLRLPEPMLVAKASAIEIAEMFLPAILVVKSDLLTRFVVGITSVSSVLFFSASIPSLMATDIPVSLKEIIIIWFERTVLSLVIATAIAYMFL